MRIVVTGGAGYIGSALIDELIKRGDHIISIDNLYRGSYENLSMYKGNPHLKMIIGDITNKQEIEEALKYIPEIDAIVHLAAVPGLARCNEDPVRAVLTNILGTFNISELARKYDAKVIFSSSGAVYGIPETTPIRECHPLNPINLYGATKLVGEQILKAYHSDYNLKSLILRFGNVYGVGLFPYWSTVIPKFVKQALEGKPLTVYGSGNQARDFIHVRDVIHGIKLALDREDVSGEVFNISWGEAFSVNFLVDKLSDIFKKERKEKVKVVHLPPREGEPYVEDFYYSIDKAKERLGFNPKWSIEDGIKQLIDYYFKCYAK